MPPQIGARPTIAPGSGDAGLPTMGGGWRYSGSTPVGGSLSTATSGRTDRLFLVRLWRAAYGASLPPNEKSLPVGPLLPTTKLPPFVNGVPLPAPNCRSEESVCVGSLDPPYDGPPFPD